MVEMEFFDMFKGLTEFHRVCWVYLRLLIKFEYEVEAVPCKSKFN